MKKLNKIVLILAALFAVTIHAYGQGSRGMTISGVITDSTGEPLTGASAMFTIGGKTIGASADLD